MEMSSEPIVGYNKRSAPVAPNNSQDDGSKPERGKEAEAAVHFLLFENYWELQAHTCQRSQSHVNRQ